MLTKPQIESKQMKRLENEFVQCLPITNFQGDHQLQLHDMVFVFQNKVVRWPEFDNYSRLTDEEYYQKLQQLPEIHFPSK